VEGNQLAVRTDGRRKGLERRPGQCTPLAAIEFAARQIAAVRPIYDPTCTRLSQLSAKDKQTILDFLRSL
jgi:hypothetical protein